MGRASLKIICKRNGTTLKEIEIKVIRHPEGNQEHQCHASMYLRSELGKALPGFFLCIFSSLTCLKKLVFSKRDLLPWTVLARLYWDLLTNGRYQPACHYF